jgi:hypothetical protein
MIKLFETTNNDVIVKKRKPRKCPKCGGKVATIFYGMPNFESLQLQKDLEDDKIVLGGCCMMEGGPVWQCVGCDTQFYRELDLLKLINQVASQE